MAMTDAGHGWRENLKSGLHIKSTAGGAIGFTVVQHRGGHVSATATVKGREKAVSKDKSFQGPLGIIRAKAWIDTGAFMRSEEGVWRDE